MKYPSSPHDWSLLRICCALVAFWLGACGLQAGISGVYGYGANATGGERGIYRPVYTVADLRLHAASNETSFIDIHGVMDLGGVALQVKSNKTLRGIWANSTVRGTIYLNGSSNVVIRNLLITSPAGGDGVTMLKSRNVIVYKCTFDNCADGSIDMTQGSTQITVAYCEFKYMQQTVHNFVNLVVGNSPADLAKITVHHCWYAEGCEQRMVKATNAFVHMFSNYYSTTNLAYAMGAADSGYIYGSDNVFEKAHNPWLYSVTSNRGVRLWNNLFYIAPTWGGAMTAYYSANNNHGGWDTMPVALDYSYTATDRYSVRALVMDQAGSL